MSDHDGRRVIAITGAGGTLGAALSRQFAGEPDTDVVLSDVSASALDATVAGLPEARGAVETLLARTWATSREVEAVVALAVERFGRLDVLISNAGVLAPNGRIHNLATEDWERAFRVNVLGAVNGIRAAVPVMRAQQSGSIVLTASVSGLTAWSHAAPYCATKAAVIQLAKVAAVEYARDGIRVNCVCPGTFRSGIHADLPPEALDAIAAKHPLGLGTAADLVGAYSYLASDASRWTTGVGDRRRRRLRRAVGGPVDAADASGHELGRRARAPRDPHTRPAARDLRRRDRHLRRDGDACGRARGRAARTRRRRRRRRRPALVQLHRVPRDDLRRQPPRRDRDADQLAARGAGAAVHPRPLRSACAGVRRGARRSRRTKRRRTWNAISSASASRRRRPRVDAARRAPVGVEHRGRACRWPATTSTG